MHELKTSLPTYETDTGTDTVLREVQSEKAPAMIATTDEGILTASRFEQDSKADGPIIINPEGKVTFASVTVKNVMKTLREKNVMKGYHLEVRNKNRS